MAASIQTAVSLRISEPLIAMRKTKNDAATGFSSTMAMIRPVFEMNWRPNRSSSSQISLQPLNFLKHFSELRKGLFDS